MSEYKQKVLAVHKDAWQSYSGRIWTSKNGFVAADLVEGKHATQTKYYLGSDWKDAASRLAEGSTK